MSLSVTSYKSYVLRSLYDWALDNKCSPYISVNPKFPGLLIPESLTAQRQLVFDLSSSVISNFYINTHYVSFDTYIEKENQVCSIRLPINAILNLYLKETGKGFDFIQELEPISDPLESGYDDFLANEKVRGHLCLVK